MCIRDSLKDRVAEADDLAEAVRQVAAGGSVIDPRVIDGLVSATRSDRRSEIDRLTPREREVLGEMAQGKSNAAIAAALVLSERAVEKHTPTPSSPSWVCARSPTSTDG